MAVFFTIATDIEEISPYYNKPCVVLSLTTDLIISLRTYQLYADSQQPVNELSSY
jgi:hypothetical protein